MTVDSENSDSRLISFKDGFNFEENYQEWSTNVSYTFAISLLIYIMLCHSLKLMYLICIAAFNHFVI